MTNITLSRRGFITGLAASLITAPSIVRASSLMPIKAVDGFEFYTSHFEWMPGLSQTIESWQICLRIADIDGVSPLAHDLIFLDRTR